MLLSEVPPVQGVTHRQVDVGTGVALHVAEAGNGPPLILLHGYPQHWWCWRHLIGPLARDYRVLAPDLRGMGWSDAPEGGYAKATLAADILGLMDAEGLDRVRLIGHDWGGYVSYLLALDHPERVDRLVTLDIPPPWRGPFQPRHVTLPLFASYQVLLASPGLGPRTMTSGNRFIRFFIRRGSHRSARWTNDELDVYARVLRDPRRARAGSAYYRTFLGGEVAQPALRRNYGPDDLEVPGLLLMGRNSALQRAFNPKPSRNLDVELIPRAGHFLPEEAPEDVLERVEEFFA